MEEKKLFGKYIIKSKLGQGGMAIVYHAFDPLLNRDVAIKVLLPKYKKDPDVVRMFLKEGQLMAELDHPNIVKVYENARYKDYFFYVMEYINGKTLKNLIKEGIDYEKNLKLFQQLLSATAYIHEKNIVHFDLKPTNILVTDDEQIKITDFGIGSNINDLEDGQRLLAGTVKYIAPEQITGEKLGPHTDIYQLGVILYEMYGGRLPFEGSKEEIIRAKLEKEPPPLNLINPSVPGYISAICNRMLRRKVEDRYKKIEDVLNDLNRFKEQEEENSVVEMFHIPEDEKFEDNVVYKVEKTKVKKHFNFGKLLLKITFGIAILLVISGVLGIFWADKFYSYPGGNLLISVKTFLVSNYNLYDYNKTKQYSEFLFRIKKYKEAENLLISMLNRFPKYKTVTLSKLIDIFILTNKEKQLEYYAEQYEQNAQKDDLWLLYKKLIRFYKNKGETIKARFYFRKAINAAPTEKIKASILEEFKTLQ